MKKLPLILAVLIGVLDAALAVGIILILADPGSGAGTEKAASLISDSFEDNSHTYGEEQKSASYFSIIRANAGSGQQSDSSQKYEPTPTFAPDSSGSASGEKQETVPGLPDSDFIFPYSSTRLITEAEMKEKLTDKDSVQRAINEIYARHGYQFHQDKNPENYAYFNSKSWYRSMTKIDSQEEVRKQFSDIEVANVDALTAYQNARSWE